MKRFRLKGHWLWFNRWLHADIEVGPWPFVVDVEVGKFSLVLYYGHEWDCRCLECKPTRLNPSESPSPPDPTASG